MKKEKEGWDAVGDVRDWLIELGKVCKMSFFPVSEILIGFRFM
jgi:hypothetical protein